MTDFGAGYLLLYGAFVHVADIRGIFLYNSCFGNDTHERFRALWAT